MEKLKGWLGSLEKSQRRMLDRILLSGFLFLLVFSLWKFGVIPSVRYWEVPMFLIPYALIGWDVWYSALQGIGNGQLLDERFLMVIATVGAFVIGEYPEGVFVMLFYQVGELFEHIAVGKSRKSIASLMNIRPDTACVLRDGKEETVPPETVGIGEILVVRPGEKIPLDGVIVSGSSSLDTRSLTGESLPREVGVGEDAVSGCVNLQGVLRIEVRKPYGESTVAKILELVENSALVKSKAEQTVTKFARIYTPSVVGFAALLAILPSLITGDWVRWLYSALIFLVVSCPCALVISVPLSFFAGLGAASGRGILVKGANYLEALADLDSLVMDKTGTLTEGKFAVSEIYPAQGEDKSHLLTLAASLEQYSNHPIAAALTDAVPDRIAVSDVKELSGYGLSALDPFGNEILAGNRKLMEEHSVPLSDPGAVGTSVFVSCGGKFLGSIVLSDGLKADSADALRELRSIGVRRLVMLTGDREDVASRIAKELDLTEWRSGLLPAEKVGCMEEILSEKQGTVGFVGDGVNDAPVLARADIGIAMGAMGADAAIEAADVVLMNDRPADIAVAVKLARKVKAIVKQNIWFALGVKLLLLGLSVFGKANLWAASFADVGVAVIAILNAMRAGRK